MGAPALAVLLAAALAGCTGVALHEQDELVLVTDAGFLTGDEALIAGELAVTEAGCIGIAGDEGEVYPTVWPRGTSLVDGSTGAIEVPGVGTLQPGDAVEGTGGYYTAEGREALAAVAERCDRTGEVVGIRFE